MSTADGGRLASVSSGQPATTPSRDYLDGLADGQADKDPDPERLAYGWNRLNDYERGYVDAGHRLRSQPDRHHGPHGDGSEDKDRDAPP